MSVENINRDANSTQEIKPLTQEELNSIYETQETVNPFEVRKRLKHVRARVRSDNAVRSYINTIAYALWEPITVADFSLNESQLVWIGNITSIVCAKRLKKAPKSPEVDRETRLQYTRIRNLKDAQEIIDSGKYILEIPEQNGDTKTVFYRPRRQSRKEHTHLVVGTYTNRGLTIAIYPSLKLIQESEIQLPYITRYLIDRIFQSEIEYARNFPGKKVNLSPRDIRDKFFRMFPPDLQNQLEEYLSPTVFASSYYESISSANTSAPEEVWKDVVTHIIHHDRNPRIISRLLYRSEVNTYKNLGGAWELSFGQTMESSNFLGLQVLFTAASTPNHIQPSQT